MKVCLSEEVLQQYFDGELPGKRMESIASHLAGCEACARSLRELENETSILSSALAPEFDIAIPTERLHQRIAAAIADLQTEPVRVESFRSRWRPWLDSFASALTPQRAFGYASLAAILAFATIFGLTKLRTTPPQVTSISSINNTPSPTSAPNSTSDSTPKATTVAKIPVVHHKALSATKAFRPVSKPTGTSHELATPAVAKVKLLPGERTYLKTIAALDTTINSGNKGMRPALQAEYQRNLALVDRAIAATRSAAKNNPNDPDAAEFMFAAYQSKVDLLNTIADARIYNRQR